MIRVLVADDHPIVRLGVIHLLEETNDIVVAGEASTGWEVLQQVQEDNYDVAVLDIIMPGSRGLDLLKQLRILK